MPYRLIAPFPIGTRVLVFAAHPDDVEACFPNTMKNLVKWGCEVTQVYSTGGEYGAPKNPEFFGKRLQRIRRREMEEALKAYGTDERGAAKIKLEWMGEIDGYLQVDPPTYQKIRTIYDRVKPEVVFIADPFLSIDWHNDHIRTAFMAYHYMKKMEPAARPKAVFGYFTIAADCYFPYDSKDDAFEILRIHRSQIGSRLHGVFHFFTRRVQGYNRRKVGKWAEGFRLIRFKPPKIEEQPFGTRLKNALIWRVMHPAPPERYLPGPKELGLR